MEDDRGARSSAVAGSPLIVAWDTCTIRGVLAVSRGRSLVAETGFEASKGHTGWLMPQLDKAINDLGLTPGDIDYVACGLGPGTFTGVKVGVACGKAVALGLRVPLVGVPTLDLIAAGAPPGTSAVVAVMDARRGRFYASAYRREGERLERVTDYLCAEPGRIASEVASLRLGDVTVAGEAPASAVRELEERVGVERTSVGFPNAGALAALAWAMARRGEARDPGAVSPIYLKEPT